LLDVITNILLKSFTFRSLNMHLYRSNINLKIDIPYLLLLSYVIKIDITLIPCIKIMLQHNTNRNNEGERERE